MLKFSVLAALRTRLQRGQHLLYLAILGAGAILLLGAAGGCDAQPVLPHRGYLPPSSSASSSYRGVTTRGGSSASAANSRDLLELIRTRLLQRGGGAGDVDDVDDVNELQEQRGFRNFDVPASQWLARRPYYQGALLGDREGGLSGEFSSELARGGGRADEEEDEEELKDDGMMMGMQQHKRGGSKQLAVGSEMEATARYLGGLSRRRKDAKHMIHTIESLMHIGK